MICYFLINILFSYVVFKKFKENFPMEQKLFKKFITNNTVDYDFFYRTLIGLVVVSILMMSLTLSEMIFTIIGILLKREDDIIGSENEN